MAPEELYQKNEKLAVYTLWRYYPNLLHDEDFQQLARIGLWKACGKFDPSEGAFVPYAMRSIKYEILTEIKRQNRLMRKGDVVSLQDDKDGMNHLERSDMIAGDPDVQWLDWNGFRAALTQRQLEIVDLRMSGYSQKEIGKRLGFAQSLISKEMDRIRQKFNIYIGPDDL